MESVKKDIVIVGAGPAGLSAAVYAGRAKLDAVLLEKGFEGGQLLNTEEVDNYLGILEVTGPQLSVNMYEHAKKFGIHPSIEEVIAIEDLGEVKRVETSEHIYETKVVILGMGATPKRLGVEHEEDLWGRGVSYCAICDGGFFRGKTVAVVGGGDKAVEDALYLQRMAEKVYLIHRRNELKANKTLQLQLANSQVEVIWDSVIEKLEQSEVLEGIEVKNVKTSEIIHLPVKGVFVAVGSNPSTDWVKGLVDLDREGYIIAGEDCHTSCEGILAIGDVRQKPLRQILTAAADGAVSVYEAEKYVLEQSIKGMP
ncbi:MAG: thioredoxin-disulfide reductase [Cellulosilyticaceae bacterium]